MCSESIALSERAHRVPKFNFPQFTGEGTATEGFVHVHFSNTCDSSDKDLMVVTGCLQRSAYKMVTSLTSLFDKPRQPHALLSSVSSWCKVWRPESSIFSPAYCVPSFDQGQGSPSHPIIRAHSLSGCLPCPKMRKLEGRLGPFTQQILARLGGLNVTGTAPCRRLSDISS